MFYWIVFIVLIMFHSWKVLASNFQFYHTPFTIILDYTFEHISDDSRQNITDSTPVPINPQTKVSMLGVLPTITFILWKYHIISTRN